MKITLVEVLVVLAIIGVLLGLLIPAINAARNPDNKQQISEWVISEYYYKNHSYLIYHGQGIVHNPDCKCER